MNRHAFKFGAPTSTLWLVGLYPMLAAATGPVAPGYGATASGFEYTTTELASGLVVAETSQLYATGGQGITRAQGDGITGAGAGSGQPEFSYANLASGILYATGDWSTEYFGGPNDLLPGPTIGQASLNDTVTFSNAAPGATGELVLSAPSAEVDGLGEVMESTSISTGTGGVGGGISQTLLSTGATLSTSTSTGNICQCTETTGGWTSVVTVPFPLLDDIPYTLTSSVNAETFEPSVIPNYPVVGMSQGIAEIDPAWSLTLPAGVTYTTASGYPVGGSSPVSGVPEPSTLSMAIVGLGLLGFARVRRRRA